MRIVRFSQQRDNSRTLFGRICQDKSKASNRGSSHVIRHIRHCHVKQASDSAVVSSSRVGTGYSVHSTISQNGILVSGKLLYHGICSLFTSIHDQGHTDCQSTNNFFMLSILGIREHFFTCLFRSCAQHDQSHRKSSSLTSNGIVLKENVLQIFIKFIIRACHSSKAQSQTSAMLHGLIILNLLQFITEILENSFTMSSMDQSESIKSTSF
mmetsp:Transcript_51805/g.161205  ORF Transcript_51805/g.161205 Transcript_51805/m.161205 type:complete len:211 (-) Transcript_51805:1378-2010(-)